MNTREFVAKGISKVFDDLAIVAAVEYSIERGEDMPTGALVFEVMRAKMYMLKQWALFADRESTKQDHAQLAAFEATAPVEPRGVERG